MTRAESRRGDDGDLDRLRAALTGTGPFVYRHLTALVGVSVSWFVASLPLVTIGPATVGAYAAIRSLRASGRIDYAVVVGRLRTAGVHAFLLSALPVVPALAAVLYAAEHLESGSATSVALAVVCAYVALYAVLTLIPAFVALSGGSTVAGALRFGRAQTTGHPTLALATALLTLAVLAATAVLTIGFVALFPALAFSLHLFLFDQAEAEDDAESTDADRLYSNRFLTDATHST